MIYLRDVIKYLGVCSNHGATLADLKRTFASEDPKDIIRLLKSGLGFGEFQKQGEGNSTRYYLAGIKPAPIVKSAKKDADPDLIEGVIDVSQYKTQKEKAEAVYASPFPITKVHTFSYRECVSHTIRNRALFDFIHQSVVDVDVRIIPALSSGGKHEKFKRYVNKFSGNKITIARTGEDSWTLTKMDYRCPERPEIEEFQCWTELEKVLRTLFLK